MVFGENELAIIILPSWQASLVKNDFIFDVRDWCMDDGNQVLIRNRDL